MISFSYATLGSAAIQQQISDDADTLVEEAKQRGFDPAYLFVGNLFLEVGAVHSIIEDFKLENWQEALETDYSSVRGLVEAKYLAILINCEKNNGFIGVQDGIKIMYTPDEPYMSLMAVEQARQPQQVDLKQGGLNPAFFIFKLKDEAILQDFIDPSLPN